MRKLIPLLEIVLRCFDDEDELTIELKESFEVPRDFKWNGMCQIILILWSCNKITNEEHELLVDYIMRNQPSKMYANSGYWWKPKFYAVRIEWLEGQIELPNY